ncbi:copper homeostasis protein CutC [Peribacillus alkalitolerans]|uniref:copper homeostasis protein CutC n=1 Tax=Peribacillus alkalitolerans TaxID=1550385 RepID=UPI0013D576F9|nr:copper homeostasis protein CutC [Peribacillus alkalitolerans]
MIELIAATIDDAKKIEAHGGDRIELVSALSEGGLTPSYGLIKRVIESVNIPVNVIIRPHSKSFVYNSEEIELMKQDIQMAKVLGANGVVIGTLNKHKQICETNLERLLEASEGMEVTFHRAIDELDDPVEGVKILSRYKEIDRILTSGGKGNLSSNTETLKNMVTESGHIKILVGGGLNFENASQVMKETEAPEYHFGTAVRYDSSPFTDISEELLIKLFKLLKG